MIPRILIFIAIFQSIIPLSGNTSLRFERITTQEGLSQNTILSIYQDRFGFMWFGTRDGLNQYDGKTFRVFNHSVNDSNSLSNSHILHLFEDHEGDLWISTQNGLTRYHRETETFTRYYLPDTDTESMVFCTFEDSNNTLWIGAREGLFYFDRTNHQPRHYRFHPKNTDRPGRLITSIFEDHAGMLWFGTQSAGLYAYNPADSTLTVFNTNSIPALNHHRVECIIEDNDQNLWIGTYGGGVNILNETRDTVKYLTKGFGTYELNNNLVRAMIKDQDDNIWIGTFSGLHIYSPKDQSIQLYLEDKARPNSLTNSSVRSLYQDSRGSVWIGTYFGGVNLLDPVYQRFRHYNYSDDPNNTLNYNVVSAVIEDSKENLWIGTERGGLNHYDRQSGQFESFLPEEDFNDELPLFTIKSLHLDGDIIWVGTHRRGLYLFSIPEKKFTKIFDQQGEPPGLYDAIINTIFQGRDNTLWLCTESYGGLFKFNPETRKLIPFKHQATIHEMIRNTDIRSVFQDDFGNLWISTKGKGIIIFNEETNNIEHFIFDPENTASLQSNQVYQVVQDSDKNIFVCTYGAGIGIFNRISHEFDFSMTHKGLLHDKVYGLVEDHDGNLWISTNRGVSRFDKKNETFRNFDYKDELPLSELTEGAFHLGRYSGNIYFGGIDGLVELNPSQFYYDDYAPPVLIIGIKLFNQEVRAGDKSKVLSKSILYTDEIVLKYHQSILTIDFATMNYIYPGNNHYAFMMEGLETTWNYVKNQSFATYTLLNPGKYTFLVKASNNDGIWNENPDKLQITILPPPWKQWWAYLIYAGLIAIILLIIRHVALKSEKLKAHLKIQELQQEKLSDINKAKIDFFTRISHEFRTPLTLIIAPLKELTTNKRIESTTRKKLNLAMQNASLLRRLADQLLDFRKLETGKESLHVAKDDWVSFTRRIYSYFLEYAQSRNIRFSFRSSKRNLPGLLDKNLIEKALFNVISNAFKNTSDHGIIKIRVFAGSFQDTIDKASKNYEKSVMLGPMPDADEEVVTISVEDNGSGIKADKLLKIFENFFQAPKNITAGTGIGLSIVKNSIQLHHGCIKVFSELHKGTIFLLILPLNENRYTPEEKRLEFYTESALYEPYKLQEADTGLNEPAHGPDSNASKLLIIEDDEEMSAYLTSILSQQYKLFIAKTASAAYSKIKKEHPDLVICDMILKDSNSIYFCRRLKKNIHTKHIPVIMLTADTSDENRLKSFAAGVDAYVTKPFSSELLKIRIKNLILARENIQETTGKAFFTHPGLQETGPAKHLSSNILNNDQKIIERINKVILSRIADHKLNVELLGAEAGMSRVQVYRKIKELTGMTAVEYIRNFRLEEAARLIRETKLSIKEIAVMTGFKDIDYFRIHFKERFKMTPSRYAAVKLRKQ